MLTRTNSLRLKSFFALLILILFITYNSSSFSRSSKKYGNTGPGGYSIRSTHGSTPIIKGLPITKILAHQPGYTVVENLYWQNRTFIFLTDQPWSIPSEKHLVSYGFEKKAPPGHQVMKIMSIRGKAVSNEVQEKLQLGNTVTLGQAMEFIEKAVVLPSPMLLNNDDNFINHYYHWIGEMFLGAWRVWNNYAWRSGNTLPPLKTVAFLQQWHKAEAPEGSRPNDIWEDRLGTNEWYTKKFFPDVTFESRSTWNARASTNQVYHIPLVILVDRGAGHRGPSAAWKPFGDVLRLPVSPDWMQNLRQRILKSSISAISLSLSKPSNSKPVVTYLERQSTTRRLTDRAHQELQSSLQKLHDEGLIEYKMESFGTVTGVGMPFEMQVATVARTDILISVHGNGLTHLLWMDPGQDKIVFEMAAKGCVPTDYSALARAVGVQYFLVNKDTLCTPDTCPPRGCVGGAKLNGVEIELDPETIVQEIRTQLGRR